MTDVTFDKDAFWERAKSLLANIKRLSAAFNQADSLVMVANDKSDESNLYGKSLALQLWLLGYEMPGTVFVFAKNQIFVLASAKKKALLAQLGSTGLGCELQVLTVNKEDKNATNFAQLLDTLRSAGRKVGLSTYKNVEGEQATSFLAALQADSDLETADVTAGLAETWAVKDEKELKHAAKAAELSADIFKLAVSKVEDVIDGDLKIAHGKLTEDIEKVFQDPVAFKIKARPDNLESCYSPIFMSGGRYDLRASATSDDANLHQGVIVIELGARYKSYCSNMARTLFIDPTDEQKETYKILLKVYQAITQTLRNNVPLSKVWEAAVTVIKTEKESLLPHFTKNCGFATGLEFREAALLINEKCAAKARTNMVFNVCIGFSEVARTSPGGDAKTSTFAVMVADTVVVTDDVCEVLTHYPRKMGELSYSLGDGNDEGEKQESGDEDDAEDSADAKKKKQELAELMAQNPEAFRRKTRSQDEAIAAKNRELEARAKERNEHQRMLYQKKQTEALALLARGELGAGLSDSTQLRPAKNINAYETPARYPLEARPYQVYVDHESESVLFPIHGRLVPFHIDTIRSVSMPMEEPPFFYYHFYFDSPQKILGKNADIDSIAPADSMFIQDIGYRARDPRNLNRVVTEIKELKKKVQARAKEAEEKQSLVEQVELIIGRNGAFAKLRDVTVKPVLIGRKNAGVLECHSNGFRFTTTKGARGDLIFSNIKHAFYQEAGDTSPAVVLHFHLKDEIIWGKKKTKDVQFYVEVVDMSQDLSNIRSRYGDQDGIQEEQEERMLRQKTNERFLDFVKRCEDACPSIKTSFKSFDAPYRALKFVGVPGKQMVDLMPTMHCLTALDDIPPFVLTLADVELAHFERVAGSLKNFDLVFVFKDYNRPPLRVAAIPRTALENLKDWLDGADVLFTKGQASFDWKEIMGAVRDDIGAFFENGGWDFLDVDGVLADPNAKKRRRSEQEGSDVEEGAEDGPQSVIQFESDSGDESDEESEYSDESDEEESSDDEDSSDFTSESDSDDYESESASDSDDVDDWDELERRAAESDRRAAHEDDSDSEDERRRRGGNKRAAPAAKKAAPGKVDAKKPKFK